MRPALALAVLALAAALSGPATASEGGEKKKGGGPSFIQLPTLTAGVFRAGGRRAVLTVDAGIDIADGKLRERALASQPRLRDAYVRVLAPYAATIPVTGAPDPDAIGASLQRATDQVLGKPGARLLLGSVMIN